MNRITAIEYFIKVNDVKSRFHSILMPVFQVCVIGMFGQVVKLEIINKYTEPFFDMLRNDMLNNKIGFSTTRRTHYQQSPERINNIDPAFMNASFQVITGRQVNRVFIF